MYEDALKEIEGTKIFFRSKDELIEGLAARNTKWVQFADRMWTELLVRHETAIAAIGEIRDGLLIDGVWVGEIGGVVKIYFALMDDGTEEIEDFAEHLVDLLSQFYCGKARCLAPSSASRCVRRCSLSD
jgi:hypothetical protein